MTGVRSADAIVLGGGLIGLCCATAIARDGGSAIVLDESRPGASSPAAAGMLAPSIDRARGPANEFAVAARDRYPPFVAWLAGQTGITVPLNTAGILQVALTHAGVRGLQRAMARDADPAAQWLDDAAVRALEPALLHALGAVFHPLDGAVDNVALLAALRAWCESSVAVTVILTAGVALASDGAGVTIRASDGETYRGRHVVVASGAWAPAITGLPRRLPVTPLRGQMLAYTGSSLRHVVFGPRGYIVPRPGPGPVEGSGGETLVGATSERTGFDATTTTAAERSLRAAGAEILPPLSGVVPSRHWAGLRPMTPDLLPILGPDPDQPAVLYACGHSRNGILMAPLTADCLSAIVCGMATPHDIQAFSIERFPRH